MNLPLRLQPTERGNTLFGARYFSNKSHLRDVAARTTVFSDRTKRHVWLKYQGRSRPISKINNCSTTAHKIHSIFTWKSAAREHDAYSVRIEWLSIRSLPRVVRMFANRLLTVAIAWRRTWETVNTPSPAEIMSLDKNDRAECLLSMLSVTPEGAT